MPSSYVENVPSIVSMLVDQRPKSILDVGIGRGKFGLLAREYMYPWEIRVDGLEIFAPYIRDAVFGPILRTIYNEIHCQDARETSGQFFAHYDLVLLIDVIEHFTKAEGAAVLARIPGRVLIATPHGYPQGTVYGNPNEAHLSEWRRQDFEQLGRTVIDDRTTDGSTLVVVR